MRRVALLLAIGTGLGLGATAVAQEGGGDELAIDMTSGCLNGTRVTVKLKPPSGAILSPVHIRTGRGEAVHLTGVTQEASVTVRVAAPRPRERQRGDHRRRALLDGARLPRLRAGADVDAARAAAPAPPRTVSGGGEG